jgi:CBS domain-containing protein
VTIPDDATLRDAVGLLHSSSIGALGVVGPHGLIGIVSERDIVSAVARRVDLDTALVLDHATTPVMSARPEDTVLDVALQMLDSGTRHLPLVDDRDRPTAMVSLRDLLRPLVLQSMTPGGDA